MKNFLKNFSFMGFLMFMLCVLLGVGDMSGAICANGTAAPLTPEGTGVQIEHGEKGALETTDYRENVKDENGSPLVHDPVDQNLVKIRPYANQLDTILRYGSTMSTSNLEFGWYSMGTREVESKVVAATCDLTHKHTNWKSVSDNYITVTEGDGELFDVTDTIVIPSLAGRDGNKMVLYVYKKDGDKLYVTASEAQYLQDSSSPKKYYIPTPDDNAPVYVLGRAAAELDVLTPALSYLPEKSTGYCQIFKTQIAQSTYEKMMQGKEIKFDISEVEEQALFEFRRRMEGSFLLGSGTQVYDPEKKSIVYRTTGIMNQIQKTFTLDSTVAVGNDVIVDLMKKVFVGNSGAKVRFALCGSDALARISKLQGIERKQEAVQTEVVYGITWSKMVSNFGTINCSHSEILDTYGLSDRMVIFDPQFIKKWQVSNMERQVIDGKSTAILNGDIIVFTETAGVAVYNPDAHCIVTVTGEAES